METELRECPWCKGTETEYNGIIDTHGWTQVMCGKCGACGPMKSSEAGAAAAWNARSAQVQAPSPILRQAMRELADETYWAVLGDQRTVEAATMLRRWLDSLPSEVDA